MCVSVCVSVCACVCLCVCVCVSVSVSVSVPGIYHVFFFVTFCLQLPTTSFFAGHEVT